MRTRNSFRTITSATSAVALALAGTILMSGPAAAAPLAATDEATLIAAISTANGNGTADVITLGASITLTGSLPAITEDLEIVGNTFTVDTDAPGYTIFSDAGAVANINLTLTGVTVESAAFGINTDYSNVTITDSVFTDASARIAGVGATITVTNSSFNDANSDDNLYVSVFDNSVVTVTGVTANGSGTSDGLDLNVEDFSTLTVSNSSAHNNDDHGLEITVDDDSSARISGTSATNNGDSGMRIDPDYQSTVTIENSSAHDNRDHGFDLDTFNDSTLTLTNNSALRNLDSGFYVQTNQQSTVTANALTATENVDDNLDLLASDGSTVTFTDCTFNDSTDGHGVSVTPWSASRVNLTRVDTNGNEDGGVLIDDSSSVDDNSTVTIVDSTIADNAGAGLQIYSASSIDIDLRGSTISGNSHFEGAGVFAELFNTSSLTVTNSTISGNQQPRFGAVYVGDESDDTATVSISHSTIVNNTTSDSGAAGGLSVASVDFTLDHSIVAGNTSGGAPADLRFDPQSVPAAAINYSLVQSSAGVALTAVDAGTGNLKEMAAVLGPLADNGGRTLTHLPQNGSPVINAGNPAITGAPATDQRGNDRIVNIIEMGSVEFLPTLPASGSIASASAPFTAGILALGLGVVLLLSRRFAR